MTVVLCSLAGGCADAPVTVLERIAPTYFEDVTPILARHCWCCHQPEGPAHDLTALAEVEAELDAIVEDIDARTMPPAALATGRTCGEAWLPQGPSAEERRVLAAWIDGGRPRGFEDGAAPVPAACGVPESEIRRVEILHVPEDQPGARCFSVLVEGLRPGAGYVTGLQARSSSPVVRSAVLVSVDGSPSVSDDGLGTECGPPSIGTVLGAWSAEAGGGVLPAGVGSKVTGNLFVRLATDPSYAPDAGSVVTTLEIGLRDSVEAEGTWGTTSAPEQRQGTTDTEVEGVFLPFGDQRLLGVSAIALELATRVSFSVVHGGQETCVAEIEPWPRAGIGSWLLSTPLPIAGGDDTDPTTLIVRCRYDTSDIPAADPSDGELCYGTFLLAP